MSRGGNEGVKGVRMVLEVRMVLGIRGVADQAAAGNQ